MSNSQVANSYKAITHGSLNLSFNSTNITVPLHFLVNDFLMSIFFLAVGIEIKKELVNGHLATRAQRVLPVICAIGGVIFPAIIYIIINYNLEQNLVGWAIPTATDIAFTVAVISMFSNKIPQSIKVFVTALAVIDDLIAVITIGLFYTAALNYIYLLGIVASVAVIIWMNKREFQSITYYIIIGLVMFLFFFYSGIHSTVSGVVLGFAMPLILGEKILKEINKFVTYGIMPIFAFFNSGISLDGFSTNLLLNPLVLGISLSLFLGKQIGIFGAFYILIKSKVAKVPIGANFKDVYIASILCGIGFTMSLFIASLAFDQTSSQLLFAKLGIILGSLASCLFGSLLLSLKKG
jgi:NhaA family Na+:H+ antiporter